MREPYPSLARMFETWVCTVLRDSSISAAMSGLERPWATSAATRTSVGVNASHPLVGRRRIVLGPRRTPYPRSRASARRTSHAAPRSRYPRTASVSAPRAPVASPAWASRTAASSYVWARPSGVPAVLRSAATASNVAAFPSRTARARRAAEVQRGSGSVSASGSAAPPGGRPWAGGGGGRVVPVRGEERQPAVAHQPFQDAEVAGHRFELRPGVIPSSTIDVLERHLHPYRGQPPGTRPFGHDQRLAHGLLGLLGPAQLLQVVRPVGQQHDPG